MLTDEQKQAMKLTDEQKRVVDLSKQVELIKTQLKEASAQLEESLLAVGVGKSFQDPEDGTVFEIVVPKGTFISFKTVDYERTRREGERNGSLSLTRAKELGFKVN